MRFLLILALVLSLAATAPAQRRAATKTGPTRAETWALLERTLGDAVPVRETYSGDTHVFGQSDASLEGDTFSFTSTAGRVGAQSVARIRVPLASLGRVAVEAEVDLKRHYLVMFETRDGAETIELEENGEREMIRSSALFFRSKSDAERVRDALWRLAELAGAKPDAS